jgi:hypothetical protein
MEIIKIITFAKRHGRDIGTIGSSVIRGQWFCAHWPEASLWTEGAKSDVLIFQKVYWSEMMECYPGIKILDLCDPDWLTGELEIRRMSRLVDAITCSAQSICEFVKKVSQVPVYYIPDRVDLNFFDIKKKHEGRAKSVVWFGYYHNAKMVLPQVLPSLKRMGLSLIVVANENFEPRENYGVEILNRKFDWQTMKYDLTAGDIVINPQPIEIQPRFRYKSENKTIIAWALDLPVAGDASQMEKFLDPDERMKEAEARLAEVKEKWDIKLSVEEFKKVIENAKRKRDEKNY